MSPYLHLRPGIFAPTPDPDPDANDEEFYGMIDLYDYGARYNVDTTQQRAINDMAIADAIADLPPYPDFNDYGGAIRLRSGRLFINNTIVYPLKPSAVTLRPINFGIIGDGVTSRIVKRGGGDIVRIIGTPAPNQYPDHTARLVLRDVTLEGGRVHLESGSKFLEFENVRITQCPNTENEALYMADLTGGGLKDIYVHDNDTNGVRLENIILMQFDNFKSRSNNGDGFNFTLWADSGGYCQSCSGMLYPESNAGVGIRAEWLEKCHFGMWIENNGSGVVDSLAGGLSFTQVVLTRSTMNTFYLQHHDRRTWHMDTESRDGNTWLGAPATMPHIGTKISNDTVAMTVQPPVAGISIVGDTITIAAGAALSGVVINITSSDPDLTPVEIGDRVAFECEFSYNQGYFDYLENCINTYTEKAPYSPPDRSAPTTTPQFAFLQLYGGAGPGGTSDRSLQLYHNGTNSQVAGGFFPVVTAQANIGAFLVFLDRGTVTEEMTLRISRFENRVLDNTP